MKIPLFCLALSLGMASAASAASYQLNRYCHQPMFGSIVQKEECQRKEVKASKIVAQLVPTPSEMSECLIGEADFDSYQMLMGCIRISRMTKKMTPHFDLTVDEDRQEYIYQLTEISASAFEVE